MTDKLFNLKTGVCAMIGAIGAAISNLYGRWSEDMVTLLIFMAIDYITGVIVAAFFKNSNKSESGSLSSIAGLKGLMKKGVILLIVLVAHRLDISLGTNYIMVATVVGFIANETISIVENVGLMGVPLPEVIKKAIEVLHRKADDDGDK